MKKRALEFWNGRNEREKRILLFCAGFILAAMLYAFIWQPGEKARHRLREDLPQLRANVQRMREEAVEIRKLKKIIPESQPTPKSLKAEIESSSVDHKLRESLSQLAVGNDGKAHLVFNAVSFDAWIEWLDVLQKESHLRLESSHVRALDEPGMVRVDATLASWGGGT